MTRFLATIATMAALSATAAFAEGPTDAVATNPPKAPYQKVSDLVALPEFLPGG